MGFRDAHDEIMARGAVVLGVSADSAARHDKFIDKFGLPFTLIADEDKSICEIYGVWGNKSFMGRTFLGINRRTFLIDADGVIRKILAEGEGCRARRRGARCAGRTLDASHFFQSAQALVDFRARGLGSTIQAEAFAAERGHHATV